MRVFGSLPELALSAGQEVAVSDWVTITQDRIDRFADATGDGQWIHVDRRRAAEGPFGTTVAHGFLTLSLLPLFFDSALRVVGTKVCINYGLNRVRFTAPVPADSQLRGRLKLLGADALADSGFQLLWGVTVERQDADKPVCVAEVIERRYGGN